VEFGDDRIAELDNIQADELVFFDTWNYSGENRECLFYTTLPGCIIKTPATLSKIAAKITQDIYP